MKSKFLLIIPGAFLLLQYGCKRIDKDMRDNTAKMTQGTSSFAMLSNNFCNLTAQEPQLDFGLERSAESNVYVYTDNQLSAGIANFFANFKYQDASGTLQNLNPTNEELSVSDLAQLQGVLQADTIVDYDPDSNYSALRMYFGMDGQSMILIYEPVALKPTGTPKACNVMGTKKYFRLDGSNSLTEISPAAFSMLTNNLRGTASNIHITHPNNPGIYQFINNPDASGDIRSNIMSMQEIVRMYCDNADYPNASDKISFSIVASQNAGSNFRTHVVAHYRTGLSSPSSGTFKNYAADYAEMCPINCNTVYVNYY